MEFSKISFQSVQAEWIKGPGNPQLNNTCHIWSINVRESIPDLDALKAFLTLEETDKAKKFHFQKDRDNYIVRRAHLRILLSKYIGVPAETIVFTTGSNKRPVLDSKFTDVPVFNLSHTDNVILIAVSDHDIGVDIERVNPDFDYSEILESNFTNDEINSIMTSNAPAEVFYRIWTRKEAILKACSKGISNDLKSIQCLHDIELICKNLIQESWFVSTFNINNQYVGSAASSIDSTPEFFKVSSPEPLGK